MQEESKQKTDTKVTEAQEQPVSPVREAPVGQVEGQSTTSAKAVLGAAEDATTGVAQVEGVASSTPATKPTLHDEKKGELESAPSEKSSGKPPIAESRSDNGGENAEKGAGEVENPGQNVCDVFFDTNDATGETMIFFGSQCGKKGIENVLDFVRKTVPGVVISEIDPKKKETVEKLGPAQRKSKRCKGGSGTNV